MIGWDIRKLRKQKLGFIFTLVSRKVAVCLFWLFIICFCFIDKIPSQALTWYYLRIASIIVTQKNWDWLECMWYHPQKAFALVSAYLSARRCRNMKENNTEAVVEDSMKDMEIQRPRYLGINNSFLIRELVYYCLFI